MPLPMAREDAPTTVRRSGVIFPDGTCFARDDTKQKKEPDVSFLLEIETLQQAGINGLTERQRAQLIVALEQAYYDAMERLGVKNRVGLKKGDVVVAHVVHGNAYIGVVESVTEDILSLRWFSGLEKVTLLELPRASILVEVVPGYAGMEGLAHVILFHVGLLPLEGEETELRGASESTALQYLTDQGDIERIAQRSYDDHLCCAAIALLESWRSLIKILIDAQRTSDGENLVIAVHDRLMVLVETIEVKELLEFGELLEKSNIEFDKKLAKVVTRRFQSLVEIFDRDIADRVVNLPSWPSHQVNGDLYDAIIAKFPDIQLKKGHYVT